MAKEIKKAVTKKAKAETEKPLAIKKIKKPIVKQTEEKVVTKTTKRLPKFINVKTIVALLVIIALAVICFKYAAAATVNGKPISRIEYLKNLVKQDNKQVLNQMIQENLILTEAQKKGIKIEQKDIDADIASIEAQIVSQGQTLEEAMKSEGITKAELEKQMKLRRMVKVLSEPKTEITQAQIDEFITKNKAQLPTNMTKDQIQALVKEELISEAESEAMTTWLQKIYQEAKIIYR